MFDVFNEASQTFVSWFSSQSGAHFSPKIQLADLRSEGAGRGIVATQDIEEGEELFTVPRKSVISVENSDLHKRLPHALDDFTPWEQLILVLIYEHLKGSQSRWKPYLDVLPKIFDTLMFWSEEELEELQYSAVRRKIGKRAADELFQDHLVPFIRLHEDVFFTTASGQQDDAELVPLAHRMGSTIMAYAFDIEKESSQCLVDEEGYVSEEEDEMLPKGMVPMADMLNADADRNNARLEYGDYHLKMVALKLIKSGEQVFNDYGALPRSALLRQYGYTTSNYAKYDVAELDRRLDILPLPLSNGILPDSLLDSGETLSARLAWLEEHEMAEDGYDLEYPTEEHPSVFPAGLIALVNVLSMTDQDFLEVRKQRNFSKVDLPHHYFESPAPVTRHITRIADKHVGILRDVILRTLDRYTQAVPGSKDLPPWTHHIAVDEEILKSGNLPSRRRMAVEVRLGEKRVLEAALKELDTIDAEIRERCGKATDSDPNKKRVPNDDPDGSTLKRRKFR